MIQRSVCGAVQEIISSNPDDAMPIPVQEPREQNCLCCQGGRGIRSLPGQSQQRQPIMEVCEIIYAEEGRQHFSRSVLRIPVMQREQQFGKKIWLHMTRRKHALVSTLFSWQLLYEGMGWDEMSKNPTKKKKKRLTIPELSFLIVESSKKTSQEPYSLT